MDVYGYGRRLLLRQRLRYLRLLRSLGLVLLLERYVERRRRDVGYHQSGAPRARPRPEDKRRSGQEPVCVRGLLGQ